MFICDTVSATKRKKMSSAVRISPKFNGESAKSDQNSTKNHTREIHYTYKTRRHVLFHRHSLLQELHLHGRSEHYLALECPHGPLVFAHIEFVCWNTFHPLIAPSISCYGEKKVCAFKEGY
ncbi:uncharacterized protein LOC131017261 [Salvia miltiorrhiza]|uniref:uncharacterized protein LOC131017261 n=1 Tax=Salvia miltiorrhiza TaxID=226208 RepID=UPI0025ACD573|nr:uncharacterized protein LOC131017261 [Salvia miltiorrhiza]